MSTAGGVCIRVKSSDVFLFCPTVLFNILNETLIYALVNFQWLVSRLLYREVIRYQLEFGKYVCRRFD